VTTDLINEDEFAAAIEKCTTGKLSLVEALMEEGMDEDLGGELSQIIDG
jgi:hypothetical protein